MGVSEQGWGDVGVNLERIHRCQNREKLEVNQLGDHNSTPTQQPQMTPPTPRLFPVIGLGPKIGGTEHHMQALPVNIRVERNLSKEERGDFTIFFLYKGVFSLCKTKC